MLSRLSLNTSKRIASIAKRTIVSKYNAGSATYSGGQKNPDSQGGFYASAHPKNYHPHRPEMLAMEDDVAMVSQVMEEVMVLESLVERESLEDSIETRSSIKKLVTSHPFVDCLERLECIKGEPVWGLSMDERQMVTEARGKITRS